MKRGFIILLVVLISALMINAYAESDPTGTWKLTKVSFNNADYDPANFNMTGFVCIMTNGNAAMILNEQAGGFSWIQTENGKVTFTNESNEQMELEMTESELLTTINGYSFTFTKKSGGRMPESINAYDKSSFDGNWVLSRISANDVILDEAFFPYANLDMKLGIIISNGIATIDLTYQGSNVKWNSDTTFSNGVLQLDKNNGIVSEQITLMNSGEIQVIMGDAVLLLSKEGGGTTSWKCPTCGNNASGKFCNNCGTAYSASTTTTTRNTGNTQFSKTLNSGTYKIGEDIPSGTYTITCVEVEDYLGDYMDALGGLAGLLDEETGNAYKSYFGLLGSLAGDPTVTVRVVDSAGYTVKSSELKQGESVILQLKSGATLQISDGKCSLNPQ